MYHPLSVIYLARGYYVQEASFLCTPGPAQIMTPYVFFAKRFLE
jgi:hypothetical protein